MDERERLEKELSEIDEELEELFKRFETLIQKRRRLLTNLKSKTETKERTTFIRHKPTG